MSMDEGISFEEMPEAADQDVPTSEPLDFQGGQDEEAVTPDEDEFNLEEFGERYVTVKVDGEDQRVKVADLPNAYMRHADYTRKTQEAARLREEANWGLTLQRAYEQNPALAIQILMSQGAQAQAPSVEEQPPEDPYERRVWELERRVDSALRPIQLSHAEQELERLVGSLSAKYEAAPYPFDAKAVAARAVELGHQDYTQLEAVYKQMAFDEMFAQARAQRDIAAEAEAENAARRTAAAGIVSHSNGTAAAMAETAPADLSLRDHFNRAWQEAGGTWD